MTNPFEEIRLERLTKKAAREKAKGPAGEDGKQKETEDQKQRLSFGNQYNEMVLRVLEQLRDALYPRYEIKADVSSPFWGIGYSELFSDYDFWIGEIDIRIEPPNFICDKHGELSEVCPLSESDLINALLSLHKKKEGLAL
jgi:hypothetical protein